MAIEKTVTFRLTVFSVPEFNLVLPVESGNAYAGQTVPIGVELSSVDQFAGEVEVSVSALPPGATAEFLPAAKATIAPALPKSIQINVHLPADNAIKGVYEIPVKAVSTAYNGQ